MRVLISGRWLGGRGGMERALHSMLRAFDGTPVDLAVQHRLDGPYAALPASVRVLPWPYCMGAGTERAWARPAVGVVNGLRRRLLPYYDLHIAQRLGPDVVRSTRCRTRVLIPGGRSVETLGRAFDRIGMQAPDNVRFVPMELAAAAVLLPPPYFDLAARSASVPGIPAEFFLTVFNPYGDVKGLPDLRRALESTPLPIVWCRSNSTAAAEVPPELLHHPLLVHAVDLTVEQLRHLYERCTAYLCFSRTEGFGWAIADALRYSRAVVSRRLGVLTFPEAVADRRVHLVPEADWAFDWHSLSVPSSASDPSQFSWLSAERFRRDATALIGSAMS